MLLPNLSLVLGGAASGKSAFAESLVLKGSDNPIYVATAQVFDDEMAQKVARHQKSRGTDWITIEEPIALPHALVQAKTGQPVLIDCATLWLSNLILGAHDIAHQTDALIGAITGCKGPVVVVSNEVGHGIVPDNALAREFRNAQGQLNQILASRADLVVAVMAGLPLTLKGNLP